MKINSKKRYSIPAKIVEYLYTDDAYFKEVEKLKKSSIFPKMDEWKDNYGFNMRFALAGYSPEDIEIKLHPNTNVVQIQSEKLEDNDYSNGLAVENNDNIIEVKNDEKDNTKINKGCIIRGIARRSFDIRFLISEEFDLLQATAHMEHGLLRIFVPNKKPDEINKIIELKIEEKKV